MDSIGAAKTAPDFVDLMLDTVFIVDARGVILHVSAACERAFGYLPDEMVGRPLFDFIAPEDLARTREEARSVMAGEARIGFENRYVRKDGRRVHVMWSARWSEKDQVRVGVARDVTDLRQAEAVQQATYAISEAAHDAEDLEVLVREIQRVIATLVPLDGMAVATCDRRTKQLSFTYQRDQHGNPLGLFGPLACAFCAKAVCGGQTTRQADPFAALLEHDADACEEHRGWLALPLQVEHETIGTLVLKCAPEWACAARDRELLNFVAEQVAIAIDRAQMKAELLRAARYDELTGLPNRRLLQERIGSALAHCARQASSIALLYVDLDDFKRVNDNFGHAAGDHLLAEVARRMGHCVRGMDTVGRLGGDEFVVLLEGISARHDAEVVAEKLSDALLEPVLFEGQALPVRASIGLALYPDHGRDIGELLRYADGAMYHNKRGRNSASR